MHKRKHLWGVWAASPSDALRISREKVDGGAEESSTYCSREDQEGSPPYMQEGYGESEVGLTSRVC